jgi:cell division GTPase FtsZ
MDRRQWIQSINGFVALQLLPGAQAAHNAAEADAELALELRLCISNAIAREPCYIGVAAEDFENLIMAHQGQCAFGFGFASQGQAAADRAIAHARLGLGRLQQAAAVLIGIETPLSALQMRVSSGIMKHVRQHLPADTDIFYSHNTNRPGEGENFRVSILATGISDKNQVLRHKPTHRS